MERLGIKLVVSEHHGMRRFLYPLCARLPSLYRRSAEKLALTEADGTLIPAHVSTQFSDEGVQCSFALSLAPLEVREFFLVRVDDEPAAAVPDPLRVEATQSAIVSRQDRLVFSLDSSALVTSVIYDAVEHLASPLAITLDAAPMAAESNVSPLRLHRPPNGLLAEIKCGGIYDNGATGVTIASLTACKSWITVRHILSAAMSGSVLKFTLPLTVTSQAQTCDFGVGNGSYGKIQSGLIDEIVWDVDLSAKAAARYRIRSLIFGGDLRTDIVGEVRRESDPGQFWLHWNEPGKALALAITDVAKGCNSIRVRITSDGVIDVEFSIGDTVSDPAAFGVCYHFLNAIPPIAAATNPASILLPPQVAVIKSTN